MPRSRSRRTMPRMRARTNRRMSAHVEASNWKARSARNPRCANTHARPTLRQPTPRSRTTPARTNRPNRATPPAAAARRRPTRIHTTMHACALRPPLAVRGTRRRNARRNAQACRRTCVSPGANHSRINETNYAEESASRGSAASALAVVPRAASSTAMPRNCASPAPMAGICSGELRCL